MLTASGSAMLFLGCAVIPAPWELITSRDVINIVSIFSKWKVFFHGVFIKSLFTQKIALETKKKFEV
jgi:hypothetical protein